MWASKEDREELRAREREGCWSGVYTIRVRHRRRRRRRRRVSSFTSDKTKDGIESVAPRCFPRFLLSVLLQLQIIHHDDREAEVETAICRLWFRKCFARLHEDSFKCLARQRFHLTDGC